MSLNVALHDPTSAAVNHFWSNEQRCACVTFRCDQGKEIDIYVEPHVADALVEAFNTAMSDQTSEVAA